MNDIATGLAVPAAQHAAPRGWKRWVYSTNHKDIGTMYLVFSVVAGLLGGGLSVAMRAELAQPGLQIFAGDPHLFNVMVTRARRSMSDCWTRWDAR